MTNPSPDNAWNALDLPVLTDVVEVDVPATEVPVYDFTAELDALAQAVPADEVPELTLPPELTLDEVLGDETELDGDGVTTSQLIERLPSLDLEVDLPAELSLDDVLPGLEPLRRDDAPAPEADFAFSLEEETPAPAAADGLSALFARASFEPLPAVAAATELSVPLAEQASVDSLAAQLDDFDVAADMPELPGDAFLSKADEQAPLAEVFAADSRDDEWAGTWEPPQTVEPPLLSADDLEQPPVAAWEMAAESAPPPLLPTDAPQSAPLPVDAGDEHLLAVPELVDATATAQPVEAPDVDLLPWESKTLEPVASAANLSLSVDDILASLQAPPVAVEAASADPAPVDDPGLPPAEAWLDPLAVDTPVDTAPENSAITQEAVSPSPLLTPWASETAAVAEAVDAAPDMPLLAPADEPAVPVIENLASAPLQAISLDSLPTGVLGGGLGLAAAAAASPAAALGQPAATLPGGGDWQPRPAFDAGDKEVELAWARDLGAEPPLDLDELPPAQTEPVAQPVIAEVIRVRRTHSQPEPAPAAVDAPPPASPLVEAASTAAVTLAAALPADDIHIEAVSEALPLAVPAAAMAPTAAPGLDEEALIEALYARVLPRMKVELTLWMQDALEQQAKQLMAGVMKQLKEDFDMMLAESLRSSLREALDEAASKQEPKHE